MPDGTRKLDLVLRWALFLAYAAVTFVLTLRHEPWADELQAWLIARDCTVPEIFKMMRWEGHFVPWYLMLHVFAAHGGPVLCMNLLSWAFMAAAGAFFVFRAPFTLPVKALILSSAGMLFWYPVVARCYAPIPLLLFLLAASYPARLKRPLLYGLLIACLTNTHAYFEGFCGIIFVLWAFDAWKLRAELPRHELRRIVAGLCVAAAGALFGFLQVAPGMLNARSVGNQRFWPLKMNFFERLATSLVDFAGCSKEVANVSMPVLEYLWVALLIVLIAWFVRRRRTLVLYLALAAVFFCAIYFVLPPHEHPFQSSFQLFLDFVFLTFFAVAMLSLFRVSRRMALVCLASTLWMIAFAMYLFYFLPQRAYLVFLSFVFCCWVLLENPAEQDSAAPGAFFRLLDGPKPPPLKRRLAELLVIYVCFTVPACVSFAVQDFRHPFSGAKNMGEYLTKTLPPCSTVVLPYYGITDAVISAYAPGLKFYCVESGRYFTFCPLDWSLEEVKRRSVLIVPDWIKEKNDEYITLIDQTGFMYSPIWEPVLEGPGPHYFVCSMRYLQALWTNPIKLVNKDRSRTFTEVYRSPRIRFTAVAGEQYWLFTDGPPSEQKDAATPSAPSAP
ncbi:MAG: hypothetical protein IKL85_07910 [Lentisphaeria bacterium]|nr:hypothetical protein [Lentisphaeria bacterium]